MFLRFIVILLGVYIHHAIVFILMFMSNLCKNFLLIQFYLNLSNVKYLYGTLHNVTLITKDQRIVRSVKLCVKYLYRDSPF